MVRDQQWIVDRRQAAREILSFAEGFDRAALGSDRRTCVDADIVWDAVSIDVPELIAMLEPLLAEENP